MKKIILLLLAVFLYGGSSAQNFNEDYGVPVIVLTEINPWLMVIGSDVPSFALYSNGHIIYKRNESKQSKYYEAKLSREEAQEFVLTLGITDSLMKASNYYVTSHATDQPTTELILNFDSTKVITVYGRLKAGSEKKDIPASFLTVYQNLAKFHHPKAEEWLPEKIELLLTDYSHSPVSPKQWPIEWPDLNSPETIQRGANLYSVYLDRQNFNDFIKLQKGLKERQAVMLNGRKFSVSYRLPFPNIR